ncbi:MAG: hypothetical protein AAF202_08865 [Pseudomonadota bacterium]
MMITQSAAVRIQTQEGIMKVVLVLLTGLLSTPALSMDYSELESPLMDRVQRGCLKYAEKQAKKHLEEHFNMNFWAGGNVGSGSYNAAEEGLPSHVSFLNSQCQNLVAEVLEMKLGYGPWQR